MCSSNGISVQRVRSQLQRNERSLVSKMATTISTASITTDITGIIDSCLPLKVFVVNSFWDVDKLSVGLAFLVGLIVGLLITLFCARLCMRDMSRNKGVEVSTFNFTFIDSRDV